MNVFNRLHGTVYKFGESQVQLNGKSALRRFVVSRGRRTETTNTRKEHHRIIMIHFARAKVRRQRNELSAARLLTVSLYWPWAGAGFHQHEKVTRVSL